MGHVEIIICLIMYALNFWILFGHKHKMRSEMSDQPNDRYFSKKLMYFFFLGILFGHILFLVRKIFIIDNIWPIQSELSVLLDLGAAPNHPVIFYSGIVIFSSGLFLRLWSIRVLGRLFTFEIGIRKNHIVIDQGPYRLIRHPSYTGYVLLLLGFGLSVNSWVCSIGFALATFIFLSFRIIDEESLLKKEFGEKYTSYMLRTKRWVPYLF